MTDRCRPHIPDSDGAGGVPIKIVTLFGDTPRALAITPDGKTVYAAVFKSGNQTMATSSELPCSGFDSPTHTTPCVVAGVSIAGAPPGPATNGSPGDLMGDAIARIASLA